MIDSSESMVKIAWFYFEFLVCDWLNLQATIFRSPIISFPTQASHHTFTNDKKNFVLNLTKILPLGIHSKLGCFKRVYLILFAKVPKVW